MSKPLVFEGANLVGMSNLKSVPLQVLMNDVGVPDLKETFFVSAFEKFLKHLGDIARPKVIFQFYSGFHKILNSLGKRSIWWSFEILDVVESSPI